MADKPCKIWPWTLDKDGYAVMTVNYRQIRVAKSVLEESLGRPLMGSELTRHLCHNKACVEGEHLILGGSHENQMDNYRAGKKPKNQKLTDDQVRQIRALAGTASCKEIGKLFGVGSTLVNDIITGKRKKHVK